MADTVDLTRITEYEENSDSLQRKIDKLTKLVKKSKYIVFYTGAGVSTSAGVPDYRGPNGCWTMKAQGKKAQSKVAMVDAQPTPTHMAMSTLIRKGIAHYVVTTNLDGIHRKSGLKQHEHICNLHGCVYVERCTGCGYDFERNWHVRKDIHVHDHYVGKCERCGSDRPKTHGRVSTQDTNCGTKDSHINFGEYLDDIEWDDANTHCGKADLVIVAGTSMTLRHITHLPFMAHKNKGKVVIINLQKTPDDKKCDLRIFSKTDCIFEGLMFRLGIPIDPIPVWRPRDSKPLNQLPQDLHPYYKKAAQRLEECAQLREQEEKERQILVEKKQEIENLELEKKLLKSLKKMDLDKVNIIVGNTHKTIVSEKSESNCHKWKMYVKPADDGVTDLEELVEKIEFDLHPTFTPKSVVVKQAPFELTRIGWGTFNVNVTVFWKEGPPTKYAHHLSFDNPCTEAVVC